jgi:hypothetical protein
MKKAYYLANFLPVYFNCSSFKYIMPILKKQYLYCEVLYIENPDVKIKTEKRLNFHQNLIKKKEKK